VVNFLVMAGYASLTHGIMEQSLVTEQLGGVRNAEPRHMSAHHFQKAAHFRQQLECII